MLPDGSRMRCMIQGMVSKGLHLRCTDPCATSPNGRVGYRQSRSCVFCPACKILGIAAG